MIFELCLSALILCISSKSIFTCDDTTCLASIKGDGICDKACMIPACDYDSTSTLGSDYFSIFKHSDCFSNCVGTCDPSLLNNGVCDQICNLYECGYDLGDCGYCNSECTLSNLTINTTCTSACNNTVCMFGNGMCGWCAYGCTIELLSNGKCDAPCNNSQCSYDNGDCKWIECAVGCSADSLTSGICVQACNNKACGYDNGKCDCSPGCNIDILSESTCRSTSGVINDPCATSACSLKNGLCGNCSVGCYYSDLMNGVCNPACNNSNCSYDYGDCQCAPGCNSAYSVATQSFTFSGGCNPYCLGAACYYNYQVCNDNSQIFESILNQMILKDNSYCTAPLLSTYTTTNSCDIISPCNNQRCLYCNGTLGSSPDCNYGGSKDCYICSSLMTEYSCSTSGQSACQLGYNHITKIDSIIGTVLCLSDPGVYSTKYYKIVYVDGSKKYSQGVVGDGTSSFPVYSLYYALSTIYASYTKIIILPTTQYSLQSDNTKSLLNNQQTTILSSGENIIKELWIMGSDSNNYTIIYWQSGISFNPTSYKFYLANIIFYGSNVLISNCTKLNTSYCFYCPYVSTGTFLLDDRDDKVNNNTYNDLYGKNCLNHYSDILFTFTNETYIENVTFTQFRYQYNYFIQTNAPLNLTNVNFIGMQAKAGGYIIYLACTSNCNLVNFGYITGNITDIAAGYEDTSTVASCSFLYSSTFNSLYFEGLYFAYNFIYNNQEATTTNYMIYSLNHHGQITITGCIFENNYANNLIYIDVSYLLYTDFLVVNGISFAYSQEHFRLQDTIFNNNYCSNSFMVYLMDYTIHNIIFSNVTIKNITVGSKGLIYISNTGSLTTTDTQGANQRILLNNSYIWIYIPQRYLLFINVNIDTIGAASNILYFYKLPLVQLNSTNISNTADGSDKSINSVIAAFSKTGRYLSRSIPSDEVPELYCTQTTLFNYNYDITLTDFIMHSTSCEMLMGSAGLYITQTNNNLELSNVTIYDITGKSTTAIALYIELSTTAIITNLSIYNIENTYDSVIEFNKAPSLYINNMTAKNIISTYNGVIIMDNVYVMSLINSTISNSTTTFGNGGCLAITGSIFGFIGNFNNLTLSNCSASDGLGGGIYLDSISSIVYTSLSANLISISNSESKDGSLIYISTKISFNSNFSSTISNLTGSFNSAHQGGSISDQHAQGLLTLNNVIMHNNTALYSVFYGYYTSKENTLKIENSFFYNDTSQQASFFVNALYPQTSINFNNVTIKNIDIISIDVSTLNLLSNILIITQAYNAIIANTNSTVSISQGNFSSSYSNVITISKYSSFICTNCFFGYNKGTAITATINSYVVLTNSIFSYNVVPSISILSISSAGSLNNSITSCSFYENNAIRDGLIYISAANLTIISSSFERNYCSLTDYVGIYLTASYCQIINSTFGYQNSLNSGGFLYGVSSTIIQISGSNFSFGTAGEIGGAIYISGGELDIDSSIFNNNTVDSLGGSIYAISTIVKITGSMFYGSTAPTADAIYQSTGILQVNTCVFSNSNNNSDISAATIYADTANVTIIESVFKDSNTLVSGLIIMDSPQIIIKDSLFQNIKGASYGAAAFSRLKSTYGTLIISNSTFTNNTSNGNGGAISSENTYVEINSGSIISYNYALVDGGGLNLISPLCTGCTFTISRDTYLFNNTCNHNGGGINWQNSKPSIGNISNIYNNTGLYGNNIATKAAYLNFNNSRRRLETTESSVIENVSPGQLYTDVIEIFLFDTYGNIVSTDNTSTLSITTDTKSNDSLSGNALFTAVNGKFSITQFIPSGPPGSNMTVLMTTAGISTRSVMNDNTVYNNSAKIILSLRYCTYGELIGATSCTLCPSSKYLIGPDTSCKACPSGGSCIGGDMIIPLPGYWRSTNLSEIVYSCSVSAACLGGNSTDINGQCASGYQGLICQACDSGYTLATNGKCSMCPNQATNIVILLLLTTVITAVAVILVKATIKSAFSPKSLYSIYIKIFTNYLQLVFLTTQFNLNWPNEVITLFSIQKSAATVSDQIFSVDCYLSGNNSNGSQESYYYKLVLLSIMPVIIAIVSLIVWLGLCFMHETYAYLKREFFTTIIVLFFLVYPNIVKLMFSNFSCQDVDKVGSYLSANITIECWNTEYTWYSVLVAIPSIIVWVFGVPTLILIIMIKRKKYLQHDSNRVVFGFLFNGYKLHKFFWEFLIMYRKIIIIAISVFMSSSNTSVQALTVVVVLFAALYIQYINKPYNHSELNHMETEALFTATITIYCGLFYLTSYDNQYFKMFLFCIMAFGNIYFFFHTFLLFFGNQKGSFLLLLY